MDWPLWLALPPLAVACASDLRRRLIPDWTAIVVAGLGIAAALSADVPAGFMLSGAACLGIGVLFAAAGVWGWGDAKLFAATGLLVGPALALPMIGAMAVTGAGLAAAIAVVRPGARRAVPGRRWPRWVRNEARRIRLAPTVPYAFAITGGVVCAAFLRAAG